jgi:hypothetical protein
MATKPILCLDFDGVCHMYTSGWKGAGTIPDPFVPGLFEFLESVQPYFDVQIFSSRSNQKGGLEAMTAWFVVQRKIWREMGGKPVDNSPMSLSFPTEKPPAFVGIDDRVLTFRGEWPDVEELRGFRPWTQNPIGATNTFPRGKATKDDEGALKLAVYHKDGTVFMDFGKEVAWLGLDAQSARQMASLLVEHANKLETL